MKTYKDLLTLYKHPFELIRLGRKGDGGYAVPKQLINDNLLSCGISNEISFENDYITHTVNTNIHCFDGTITKFPSNNVKFNWHQLNIAANDTDFTVSFNTIFDVCFKGAELFAKIDIEGYEYESFCTLTTDNLKKINCLVLEVHDIQKRFDDFSKLMKTLNTELVLIHKHDNNNGYYFTADNETYCNTYELTFVNKKFIEQLEVNDIKLPLVNLDFNNR